MNFLLSREFGRCVARALVIPEGCEPVWRINAWTPATRKKYSRKGLQYESDVTDAEWKIIEPLLRQPGSGRPRGWADAGNHKMRSIASCVRVCRAFGFDPRGKDTLSLLVEHSAAAWLEPLMEVFLGSSIIADRPVCQVRPHADGDGTSVYGLRQPRASLTIIAGSNFPPGSVYVTPVREASS